MAVIEVDASRAPLVVVTYPEEVTEDDYRAAWELFVDVARRGEPVGWLVDLRRFNPLTAPPDRRRKAAEIFAQHSDAIRHVTAGEARVVPSRLARGVLAAFDWLTGSKWPLRHFESMEEAERWLEERLAAFTPPH